MTNLDIHPAETQYRAEPCREPEVITPRDVPLGGLRAMTVRRTLPSRERPFIGPWCFADHYGPDAVQETGGMDVPPHPHCGLQTVSWLFRGEIEHRDSLGTHEVVLPGELNLMTAGRGIAHSEVSTRATTVLHGLQLWVALPEDKRDIDAGFQHYATQPQTDSGVTWRVFLGSLGGVTSPVPTFSPLVGAEVSMATDSVAEVALDPGFEHGVLVDTGTVEVDGQAVTTSHLAALPVGRTRLRLHARGARARVVLIGGAPMESDLVMWWNFVGSSHEEIAAAREEWQDELTGTAGGPSRFGRVLGYDGDALPAPVLPGGRLRSRSPKR